MQTAGQTAVSTSGKPSEQRPFALVAPFLGAALLTGTAGGFIFATVLTLSLAFNVSIGPWWAAMAQAHGHLQLYGWAGLFVLGVALHFLPRLRGTPLALPRIVPWILGFQVTGLVLRAISQPLLAATGLGIYSELLLASGILEGVALVGAVLLLGITAWRGPSLVTRPAFLGVLPFLVGAFSMLAAAGVVNLVNVVRASPAGFIPAASDDLNVTLGLFGFLVPVALAMSVQSLPMYAGLAAFPRQVLWPLAASYFMGLVLTSIGSQLLPQVLEGSGMLLMGIVLLVFIGIFLRMMRMRGRLPPKVAQVAPSPEAAAQTYQRKLRAEHHAYGPFVAVVASAYLWAILGGILLTINGLTMLFAAVPVVAGDTIRHSLAIGFITLLICGIAPRMLPGFSGGHIASPALVNATLWLGNTAALLRVGSLLLAPLLVTLNVTGISLYAMVFGLSGPLGLALAICLTVNLWPALWPPTQAAP
jgi:uncharacterized protein involved in response to NO